MTGAEPSASSAHSGPVSFSDRLALSGFLAAVFLVKLAVLFQLKGHPLLQPDAGLDTTAYLSLARQVADGNVALGPGLYIVSPLYIYFVAVILALTGSDTAVRVVQILLGTVAVGLVWWTAREWFGRRAAWIAAALAALTGLFSFYESLLLQAALDPVLTACALAALAAALNRGRALLFLAAGAAFGLQALNRPNVLLAAVGLLVLVAAARRYRGAAAMLLGLILALAPVTLRNIVIAGDWSPMSSHGGLNFYIGNNPEADGTYHSVPGITPSIAGQRDDARRVAEQATGRSLDDADVSVYFYGLGLKWVGEHSGAAGRLFLRKVVYTFNSAHLSLNFSYPFYERDAGTLLGVLACGPWLLIPLGLAGLGWAAWRRRNAAFLIWAAFVPLYAVAVAVFFVSERYRLPLLVPLCVGSGAAGDALIRAAATRHVGFLARMGAALVVLFAAAHWPFGLDDARAEERTRMAERAIALKRFAEGESWAAKAEEIHPLPGVLHFRLGRQLLAAGRAEAAVVHLRRSAGIDPARREVDFALGQALLESGRPSDAVPHLRRAFEAGVRTDLSGFDLARALASTGD